MKIYLGTKNLSQYHVRLLEDNGITGVQTERDEHGIYWLNLQDKFVAVVNSTDDDSPIIYNIMNESEVIMSIDVRHNEAQITPTEPKAKKDSKGGKFLEVMSIGNDDDSIIDVMIGSSENNVTHNIMVGSEAFMAISIKDGEAQITFAAPKAKKDSKGDERLTALKKDITDSLEKYSSKARLTMFAHHRESSRARVIEAITGHSTTTEGQVSEILRQQRDLMTKSDLEVNDTSNKFKFQTSQTSGLLKAINEALAIVEQQPIAQQQPEQNVIS